MRFLVLGAGGMAGHMIALRLAEKGHNIVGLARRRLTFCDTIVHDIADTEFLQAEIVAGGYDAVVNAVGILPNAIVADLAKSIWINAYFPHWLARATAGLPTKVIHLSTDCVFSGHESGGYAEGSFRSADDAYGRSKALGELNDEKNLTFRTSIIGPDINESGVGLFHWFMGQSAAVTGYSRAIWTGVTTLVLADAIEAAAKQNLSGLYHLVNGQTIAKDKLLRLFNAARREPISIAQSDTYVSDKSLINTRSDFDFAVPPYDEMVKDLIGWISAHHELYPHYLPVIRSLHKEETDGCNR